MDELTIEQLKAQLEEAKLEAYEAQKAAAAANSERDALLEKIKSGDLRTPISGSYKGYKFDDGHRRVRDQKGKLCDTEKLLASAADKKSEGHNDAVEILEWLIRINYAHFNK